MASSSSASPKLKFPPCPEGYHPATETPDHIICWTPNNSSQQEKNFENNQPFDFNNTIYLVTKEPFGVRARVSNETLQQIVTSPNSPWVDELKTMSMKPVEGGRIRAAYLPYLLDIWHKVDIGSMIWKLENFNLEYEGKFKVVPKFLKDLIDPLPEIKFEGPIYHLNNHKVDIVNGNFTDGLQIFHVNGDISSIHLLVSTEYMKEDGVRVKEDPRFRCHAVRLAPVMEKGKVTFNRGSAVIVWNVRDVARPSFVDNFTKLVSIHKPVIVVLTEVRVSKEQFKMVFAELSVNCGWLIDESCGLMGGVVVLCDCSKALPHPAITKNRNSNVRMVVEVKAVTVAELRMN